MKNEKYVCYSYKDLLDILNTYLSKEDLELIDKYYEESKKIYDGMKRISGEDYICHPINVAYSLAELKMDAVTIGCSLIHDAIINDKLNLEEILEIFGEETRDIISSITKISELKRTFKNEQNLERYRKIVVGLSENPKALFIKLADRLDNLKTVYVHSKEHQKEIIEETNAIFIPIAHRLGIKKIKSELEDLCLKFSNPDEYQEVLDKLNTERSELEKCLSEMKEEIVELLSEHKIKFEISSRVKSVRGIYNKLKAGKKWADIYDLLGLRVIVNTVEECYLVIGLIHSKYTSIPKRFKDYIANPKNNMYQSLHTTIFGVAGEKYEVQVRTHEMDELAESGVASHWSYKEHKDGSVKSSLETRLEAFKTLIDINDEENNLEFFKNLNNEINKEEIYVFTPKGDIIELPADSTPIDFAYRIHSEVGNTTVSAIVNNKIVKLDYKLSNGDIVSLNTQAGRTPNKAWLKTVKTDTAKSRIKSYFSKLERDKILATGRELLEKEIKKKKLNVNEVLSTENIKKILEYLKIDSEEDLYFGIYNVKWTPTSLINKITNTEEDKLDIVKRILNKEKYVSEHGNVLVAGTKDILNNIASCCNPVYGEEIVGYITKGNGVSIHRRGCKNLDLSSDRIIDVVWNNNTETKYYTILNVYVENATKTLVDIITAATKQEIIVESVNLKNKNKSESFYELAIKVNDINNLDMFILELEKLKNVLKIERGNN